jgi:flagellar assembly factor FliW
MKTREKEIALIKLNTTRFGDISIAPDKIINFVHGIPGFEKLRRYILIDHDAKGLFKWLQSVDEPAVAFLMTDPIPYKPGYSVPMRKSDIKGLDAEDAEGIVVLVMVCVSQENGDDRKVSLNLKGPVLFNASNMLAIQCIIDRDDYQSNYVINL